MDPSSKTAFESALVRGAEALGVRVSDGLVDSLAAHQALVDRWAQKINLSAIRDPVAQAELHALDSLLYVELLPAGEGLEVVDVGSGAGFPGLVIAMARPDLSVTLLEPHRRRASFLRVALATLARPDVRVVEGRLEPVSKSGGDTKTPPTLGRVAKVGREPIAEAKPVQVSNRSVWPSDVIVSRATLAPSELITLASARLRPAGCVIVSAGSGALDEQGRADLEAATGFSSSERRRYVLPGGQVRILDRWTRSQSRP